MDIFRDDFLGEDEGMTDRRKKALIEMAKRGTPEEKLIAESIIAKTGISIENQEMVDVEFTYKNKIERRLIHQIRSMVTNTTQSEYRTSKSKPKTIWFDVTRAQEIEINLFYSIYRREIEEEIEITYNAFVQKNLIFPQSDIDNPAIPDEEQAKRNKKIWERAGTIDKTHIRKQIQQGV